MNAFTVTLDPSFDLYQGGYPNDEDDQEMFETAYRDAAEQLSAAVGIEIEVSTGRYACFEPTARPQSWTEEFEAYVWQAVHDCLTPDPWEVSPTLLNRQAAELRRRFRTWLEEDATELEEDATELEEDATELEEDA